MEALDAGVIIGKGGNNVANLRDETGVKAGVSKVVPGVHERVLTVSGDAESVAKVCIFFLPSALLFSAPSRINTKSATNAYILHCIGISSYYFPIN